MLHALPSSTTEESTPDETTHRLLASSNQQRLTPRRTAGDFDAELEQEASIRRLERRFVESERAAVRGEAQSTPADPAGFANWFTSLNATGSGQNDALFPWLAQHADREALSWFLDQELAQVSQFADLVAFTLVSLPTGPKLELARTLLDELAQHATHEYPSIPNATIRRPNPLTDVVWESLALDNLMIALATARHYAYQSLGALGAFELTAPTHLRFVRAGLVRVGLSDERAERYLSQVNSAAQPASAWLHRVLLPLIANDSTLAPVIAEGALLRLRAEARCFERYRRELWSTRSSVARFEYADEPSSSVSGEPT